MSPRAIMIGVFVGYIAMVLAGCAAGVWWHDRKQVAK